MFIITEILSRLAERDIVKNGVSSHVIIGGRKAVLHTALNHAGLPKLRLKIEFCAIDIDHLLAIDNEAQRIREKFIVIGQLGICSLVVIAVIVHVNRQFALQGLAECMRIVEVRRMLRRSDLGAGVAHALTNRIGSFHRIGEIPAVNDLLIHPHIGHLENETEGVDRVDIPIVTHLHHIILEIHRIARIGIVLQRRGLAISFEVNIILRKDLSELAEGIGFLAAIVEVKRYHIHLQPSLDIAEVHPAICG